jgi:hypothetical protein
MEVNWQLEFNGTGIMGQFSSLKRFSTYIDRQNRFFENQAFNKRKNCLALHILFIVECRLDTVNRYRNFLVVSLFEIIDDVFPLFNITTKRFLFVALYKIGCFPALSDKSLNYLYHFPIDRINLSDLPLFFSI